MSRAIQDRFEPFSYVFWGNWLKCCVRLAWKAAPPVRPDAGPRRYVSNVAVAANLFFDDLFHPPRRPVLMTFSGSMKPREISFGLSACGSVVAAMMVAALSTPASAQDACCAPAYQVQCETVMEPQTVRRFRLQTETEMVPEEVVQYRPVVKTRYEQRSYRVAKPVTETRYREEIYSVLKPVTETSYRDETVQRTRMVEEMQEREESVTRYRPVTETKTYQQAYQVARPVTETSYYDQTVAVNRPVTETYLQTQNYTSMRPVTTMETQTVDAGGYVPQTSILPGSVGYQPTYVPGTHAVPGPFGLFARVRGSYGLTPVATPPLVQQTYAYRPNYLNLQVARTTLQPELTQVQVPVQQTRMQTEYQTRRVPVQRTRMTYETVTQNVPVQSTRMQAYTEVRKIPFMVRRPVTETYTQRRPVTQTRYVTEERVRKVPVQSTRMTYETRQETVPVQYTEYEKTVRSVLKPVTRSVYQPYEETVMVPRQVSTRVPVAYDDPFSYSIASGVGSALSSYSASRVTIDGSGAPPLGLGESIVPGSQRLLPETVTSGRPAIPADAVQPADSDPMTLESPGEGSEPQTRLKSMESWMDDEAIDPQDAETLPQPQMEDDDLQLDSPLRDDYGAGFSSRNELVHRRSVHSLIRQPVSGWPATSSSRSNSDAAGATQRDSDASVRGRKARVRLHWTPRLSHEI